MRALVHRQDERSAVLRARGVEIAVGEMTDVERVASAMQGVQRAYWLPPYDPAMLAGAAVFAITARQARLTKTRRASIEPAQCREHPA